MIRGPDISLQKLYPLQAESRSYHSQLVEILGVSMVIMECDNSSEKIVIDSVNCEREFCRRCRRNARIKEEDYCDRCSKSIAENELFQEKSTGSNSLKSPLS